MAVLRGAAGWIIRQAAAMQAAGGRRWRACPPRWRRWWLRCCCEVWQGWQAVGAVQVVQGWRWCVVIVCGGLLLLAWSSGAALAVLILPGAGGGRCDLLRLRCAGVVIVATAATPSACRAADPAGRAGGRRGRWAKGKRPGRRRVGALLLWPSVCTGGAICCAGCIPVRLRGAAGSAPRSGAGLLRAGARFRAQRFQLGNVPAWRGLRWRCSIRCRLSRRPEGSDCSTLPGSALGVGLDSVGYSLPSNPL